MANTIIHKISSVAAKVPLTTDLVPGELAINTADSLVYIKNDSGSVVAINNTSNVTEGTNLYYTDSRSRSALSVSGDLAYNSTTGVISYTTPTERTDAEVRGLISAGGDLAYNSTTGVMSVTLPTEPNQTLNTTDNVSFNNLTVNGTFNSDDVTATTVTIAGNLTVSGTTTTVNSTELSVADKNIVVANGSTDDSTANGAGITFGAHAGAGTLTYDSGTDSINATNVTGITATTFTGALNGNATTATNATTAASCTGNAATATTATNATTAASCTGNAATATTATKLNGQLASFYQKKTQAGFPQIADATLSSGTHTFDYASGDMQQLTASGNITIAFSNFVAGEVSVMMVDAVNWGAHTITLPVGMAFNDGVAPTFTASGTDRIIIINDKDNVVTMFVIGQAIA